DGDRLGDIDVFAAAVVALAGIAFGVLVGELAALDHQHRAADVVLRGNQLDVVFLALIFEPDGVPHLRVGLGEQIGGEHFGTGEESGRFYQPLPWSPRYGQADPSTRCKLRSAESTEANTPPCRSPAT